MVIWDCRCFNLMGLAKEFEKAAGPEGDDGKVRSRLNAVAMPAQLLTQTAMVRT